MKLEPNKEAEHGEEKKSNIFEKKTNQKWKNEMRRKGTISTTDSIE